MTTGTVVVTGGGGIGIGSGITQSVAATGRPVAIVDKDADAAGSVARRLSGGGHVVQVFEFDVAQPDGQAQLIQAVERSLGPIGALVNSAGVGLRKPIAEVTPEEWDRVMTVNVRGAWLMARAALAGMIQRRGGCVVSVGSLHGSRPAPGFGAYGASKAALAAVSRSIAADYGHVGIRAVTVLPGRVRSAHNAAAPEADIAHYVRHRQMLPYEIGGRDVGDVVAMLISPAGRSITAAEFAVDAGSSAMAWDRDP